MFFVEASRLPGDLNLDVLAFHSITRGGCTVVFASSLAVQLEPHGGTSSSCEAASSEFVPGAHSAPPGRAFITAAFSREGLDWCDAITEGVTMVGDLLLETFARSELLV